MAGTNGLGFVLTRLHGLSIVGCTTLALAIVVCAIAGTLTVPFTAPTALNTNAIGDTGIDLASRLTTDGQGQWIAVWHSTESFGGTVGSDNDIFFSRSNDNGTTWSPLATLNATASSDGVNSNDSIPFIITDGNGNWIAAWESNHPLTPAIGNEFDIFVSRSADNGATWTFPAPLNGNAHLDSGADYDIDIATDRQGLWVAAWRTLDTFSSSIGNDADVLVSRSNDAGATWTYPVVLNTNAVLDSGHDIKPSLACDGLGNWIAVWHSSDSLGSTIGTDYDILLARSTDNANSWSAPLPLNSNAATDVRADTDARIITNAQGVWMAVWSSEDALNGTIGTDRDILVSRSIDNGETWSAPMPLNTNAATDSGQDLLPRIAMDHQGRWLVVWQSSDHLGNTIGVDFDILISQSEDDGLTWSTPIPLNTNATTDSGTDERPFIANDLNGAWVSVWESRDSLGGTIGTEPDILHARFALPDCNLNTIPDSSETDCNSNGTPDDCDIATGTSADANNNNIPDECEPVPSPCPADIAPTGEPAGDGVVNVSDLLMVINNWGACSAPPTPCPADIAPLGPPSGDGAVDVSDLLMVINSWGTCPK